MTVRILTRPNIRIEAYREHPERMAEMLEGITLQIGSHTLSAPLAAQIYRFGRNPDHWDQAVQLLQQHLHATTITNADLNDFLYLLDDTMGGAGVPTMARGERWTVVYNDMSGRPSPDLFRRLTDPGLTYGTQPHRDALYDESLPYVEATPHGQVPPSAGIRIVYTRTAAAPAPTAGATVQHDLTEFAVAFFLTGLRDDQRARGQGGGLSRQQYRELFSDGYESYSLAHLAEGARFLETARGANNTDIRTAARRAIDDPRMQIAARGRDEAIAGLIDFFVVQRRLARLDDDIAGRGLWGRGIAVEATHFVSSTPAERDAARTRAGHWRGFALGAIRRVQTEESRINSRILRGLQGHVGAAHDMYLFALSDPAQVPAAGRAAYFGRLREDRNDIWGAYKRALNPTSQFMSTRIAMLVLTNRDPVRPSSP